MYFYILYSLWLAYLNDIGTCTGSLSIQILRPVTVHLYGTAVNVIVWERNRCISSEIIIVNITISVSDFNMIFY